MSLILLGILNSQATAGGVASDWDFISSNTIGSNTASFSLSTSSLTGYKNIAVLFSFRSYGAFQQDRLTMQINSLSANYASNSLYGDSSSGSQARSYTGESYMRLSYIPAASAASQRYGMGIVYMPDFRGLGKAKAITGLGGSAFDNSTQTSMRFGAINYSDTNAIDFISFKTQSAGIAAGSAFTLVGMKG